MSQQEIIDIAIETYIKTNDNTARQYLKLRQDTLETAQFVKREIAEFGKVSAETSLRLEKLKFEHAKTSLIYRAYIDNISLKLDGSGTTGAQVSAKLGERYDELLRKKDTQDAKMQQLKTEHKPVVEKMRQLASNFEARIGHRRNSSRSDTSGNSRLTPRGSAPDEDNVLLDFASTAFSIDELELQFADVDSKLAALKTVDEISNETDSVDGLSFENPSIELTKYLTDLLQNGRAYGRIDDATYHFDVTKSASGDLGGTTSVIDDYESAINKLTKEIQGLVARGTEAKERWISNAQKVEMILALLDESMVIDG